MIKRVTALLLFCIGTLMAQMQGRHFENDRLDEASGLLVSQMYPGVLWSHNDAGDKARLYALDAKTLKLISRIKIKRADNVDWEDISYHNGQIVIADTGNNKNRRDDLTLYFIDEPNPYHDRRTRIKGMNRFVYEDQHSNPKLKNYDCEALFSFHNRLYLLTKHRSDTDTTLYFVDKGVAKKIADYPIGGKVTAADSDGKRIAVLTYESLYLFEPNSEATNLFEGSVRRIVFGDIGQVEGVALEGEYIHIISEDGDFFSLHVTDLEQL